MMAGRLLKHANGRKYYELMKSMMAQYAFSIDVYLKTLIAAYEPMENYEKENHKHDEYKGRGGDKNRKFYRKRVEVETVT